MNTIERIVCGNVNCYLVQGDNGSVLVDTARTKYRDKILQECKGRNVKLIVLTHSHVDHAQNAAYFSKAFNVPIAMHKADYELSKDNMAERLSANTVFGKLILALSIKSFQQDKIDDFEPTLYLHEGQSLKDYGVNAHVIELPGHTKGSIGIVIDETGMIVGDALMNMISPSKSMLYGDRKAMEQSAERIRTFIGATIYFGHGKPVKNKKW